MFDKENIYVILNGTIVKRDLALLPIDWAMPSQNFQYEEIMHANGGEVQFSYEHIENIERFCNFCNLIYPPEFKNNLQPLKRDIEKLLHKNRYFQGVKVAVYIFAPRKNTEKKPFGYFVDVKKIPNHLFIVNKTGLTMDIFDKQKKQISQMSNFELAMQAYQLAAEKFTAENKLNDCFIVNEKGNIIESLSCNVFIVKNDGLYTPTVAEGCTNRVIRNKIIDIAILKGFRMLEIAMLTPEIIFDADEVILAHPVDGLFWVRGMRQRRYFNKNAQKIADGLNELAFGNNYS